MLRLLAESQQAAGPGAGVPAAVIGQLAVDDDKVQPFWLLFRSGKGCDVPEDDRVEDRDVRPGARCEPAPDVVAGVAACAAAGDLLDDGSGSVSWIQ
jgi:hypothetical protein